MFCLYCGTKIPDDAVFCLRCGKRQHQESLAKRMPEAQETAHMDREPTIERTPLAAGSVSSEQNIPDSEEKTRNTPPGISQPTSGLTRPVTVGQPKKGRMSSLVTVGVFLLVLLLTAGGIGVYLYMDQQNTLAQERLTLAHTTAQQFCEFLVQKDYQSAYSMVKPGSWDSLSDFQSYVENEINSNKRGQHNLPQGYYHVNKCYVYSNYSHDSSFSYIGLTGGFDYDDTQQSEFILSLSWNESNHRYDVDVPKDRFVY